MYNFTDHYMILVDGVPTPVESLEEWGRWCANEDNRRVGLTTVGKKIVSTVFLGVNHGFSYGKPLWFETMIYNETDGAFDDFQERYATLDEARRGHDRAVAVLESEAAP